MTKTEIGGHTRLCGLIGNPVEHTVSPLIHNTLAGMLGHDLVYVPFHVEKDRIRDAVKGAYGLNILGLNVTVPYKSDVLGALAQTDPLAEKIGAVNTLVRTEGGYKGYNTDISGLYRAMKSEGIEIEGAEIALFGAGGAARAAAFLCGEKKAKKVYLLNRSLEKAKSLADEVNRAFERECLEPMALSDYEALPSRPLLAIQGTSVGLHPDVERTVIEDPEFYRRIHTAYDLIYNPEETKFMRRVREAGGKAYNGLKMLLYQGIAAYELWNKVEVSQDMIQEIYRLLQEKNR